MRLVDRDYPITREELRERWPSLSRMEQMEWIGDAVRASIDARRRRDEPACRSVFGEVFELFLCTFTDPKWSDRTVSSGGLKEPAIAFAITCDAIVGGNTYGTDLESLDRYFMQSALAARRGR